MKYFISIIFIFITIAGSSAEEDIITLQELIKTTQNNLKAQQELLASIIKFKEARKAFVDDPTSSKLATILVKRATEAKKQIQKENLHYLFSQDLLTELDFFNKVAAGQRS